MFSKKHEDFLEIISPIMCDQNFMQMQKERETKIKT
jgi:hypothetical protein